jgi:hypothetical protein
MKKLLLALLLVVAFAVTASAQARMLRVTNYTSCTTYVQIRGAELCTCAPTYLSGIIAVPPSSSIMYSTSAMIPGFPAAPKAIVGAVVMSYPGCTGGMATTGIVGEASCGFPNYFGYITLLPSCAYCTQLGATWVSSPMPACMNMAELIFR